MTSWQIFVNKKSKKSSFKYIYTPTWYVLLILVVGVMLRLNSTRDMLNNGKKKWKSFGGRWEGVRVGNQETQIDKPKEFLHFASSSWWLPRRDNWRIKPLSSSSLLSSRVRKKKSYHGFLYLTEGPRMLVAPTTTQFSTPPASHHCPHLQPPHQKPHWAWAKPTMRYPRRF